MSLIVSILFLLVLSRIAGELAERFGQPAMIGEIAAGLVLGPSLLGVVPITPELSAIAELGILLLMLLAGMEIETDRLWRAVSGRNIWISVVGFVLPFVVGLAAALWMDLDHTRSIFVGLCIAITALPVSVRILLDLGRLQSPTGQQIIGAAIANDVLALLALGVILDTTMGSPTWGDLTGSIALSGLKIVLFMAAVLVVSRLASRVVEPDWLSDIVVPRMKGKEPLFGLALAFVLGFAAFADLLGLHFVVGAFFGAMLITRGLIGPRNFEDVHRTASGITMGFLAPLFFATIGLEFDARTLTDPMLIGVVLTSAFGGKILAGRVGGWLAGLTAAESWALGVGLNGRGIMELVVAKIALSNGFIGPRLFSVLVLVGVVTTIVTPALLKRAFNRIDGEVADAGAKRRSSENPEP